MATPRIEIRKRNLKPDEFRRQDSVSTQPLPGVIKRRPPDKWTRAIPAITGLIPVFGDAAAFATLLELGYNDVSETLKGDALRLATGMKDSTAAEKLDYLRRAYLSHFDGVDTDARIVFHEERRKRYIRRKWASLGGLVASIAADVAFPVLATRHLLLTRATEVTLFANWGKNSLLQSREVNEIAHNNNRSGKMKPGQDFIDPITLRAHIGAAVDLYQIVPKKDVRTAEGIQLRNAVIDFLVNNTLYEEGARRGAYDRFKNGRPTEYATAMQVAKELEWLDYRIDNQYRPGSILRRKLPTNKKSRTVKQLVHERMEKRLDSYVFNPYIQEYTTLRQVRVIDPNFTP